MKQYLLFSLFFILTAGRLDAQAIEVPTTKQPLITKRTASWCPKCGGYGWELFRNLLDDQRENALVMAAHMESSQYGNPASIDLINELGGFGQPIFFLNKTDLSVNSGNIDQVQQEVQDQVAQINSEAAVAQTGILAYPEELEEELVIRTKTKFFAETAEEVSLAVYLIQPSFIGDQSGQGSSAEHKNLLRLAVGSDTFGESLGADFAAGEEIDREFRLSYGDLQAAGFDDLAALGSGAITVAAVLWTGESGNRSVLNTHHVGETTLTGVQEPEALAAFELFPSPALEQATVQIVLDKSWAQAQLQLTDSHGRVLQPLFQGSLQRGAHTFPISRGNLPAGQYWLRLSDGQGVAAKALIFR